MSVDVVALRRELHRIPELGFRESKTSAHLKGVVSGWGELVEVAGTGFYVDLGPADAAQTLLLRADMDGLPVTEETGLPFASVHEGRMHACGHDAHMAALVAAGEALSRRIPEGLRVRVLFQPAEEGDGGALRCIEDGVLDGVDLAFGLHVWNELPVGTVALTAGGIMAGVIRLDIVVKGRGGHGAMPHQTADPIIAASELVLALQTVVSRRMSPLEPAVLTIGSFHGGDAFNVIPDSVALSGTVRHFSHEAAGAIEGHIREVAAGIAAASGTEIEVSWTVDCIPTVNDAGVAALAREAAARVEGLDTMLTDYRTMAGEDFGDILAVVPGCYALVGSGNPDEGLDEPHHSPRFAIDEAVLPLARALHEAMVAVVAERG